MRPPNLIICGAQKSGTTALKQILQECGVHFPPPDPTRSIDLKFFSDEREYARGLPWYLKQFELAHADELIGEKSVSYMDYPEIVPERIYSHLRNVKLIFILRNPVDRAFSHYQYSCFHGFEQMKFSEALVMEKYRASLSNPVARIAKPWAYTERGMYASQIEPFDRLFPGSQLHYMFSEDLAQNPEPTISRLMVFLGIEGPAPVINAEVHSAVERLRGHYTRQPSKKMQPWEKMFLLEKFAEPNRRLQNLIGRIPHSWSQMP